MRDQSGKSLRRTLINRPLHPHRSPRAITTSCSRREANANMSPVHAFIPSLGTTGAKTSSLSSVGRTVSPLKSTSLSFSSSSSNVLNAPKVNPYAPLTKEVDGRSEKPNGRGARASRIVVLFGDDLRVYDNEALSKGAIDATRVPNGVLIPVVMSNPTTYASELAGQLESLGSSLLHVPGLDKLSDLIRRMDIEAVYMNHSMTKQGVMAQKRVMKYVQQAHERVQIESFWSNCLLAPPSDSHLQCTSSCCTKKTGSTDGNASCRATVRQIYADVKKQPLQATIEGVKAPQSLPALPTAVGMAFKPVKASNSGSALNDALKTLNRMDKECETLALQKTADMAVVLKKVLDNGVLSPRIVAKHVHRVMNGLKGRTFSELVWRTYVCLSACRAAGIRTVRTNSVGV